MRVLKFILETSKPYRWYMYGTLFAIGIISIDANIKPYLIKLLIDTAVNPEKANLWVLITIFATSQILMILSWSLVDLAMAKYNPQHRAHMTAILTNRINHYSYTFFQNNLSGSIVAKIGDVFNLIPKIVSTITCQFVVFFLTLLITLILLAKIHILFAIGLLLWISIFLTVTIYILTKKIKVFTKDYAESRSVIFGHLSDYLTNMLNVKLFATTIFEMQKLNLVMQNFINKAQKYGYVLTKFYFVQGIIVSIYIMGFLLWLIALQNKNLVTAGDFTLIVILNFKMLDKMYEISHHIREFVTDWGSVEQAISILETAPEIQDQPNASILQINRGEIIFDQIKFYYKGTEALFQNKSVVIAPGQKVGLVGYSGGGKSTFVNLILRLYDVIDGRVLIDNQDIRQVTQDSLHAAIGMIPQDPSLFHRSIIDNIRCGRLNATYEEVIDAARHARAHEFILRLPQGYESLVGERGVKLSGGQRQRIAIARTILKNAPILILDEATSQLDSMTENNIQESLRELMQNKTTIVVAHRLSTILHMDRILVFDQGKIVEDGTHQELLAKSGLYKTLWNAQVGGFLLDNLV
jgi:ATP-binding cassette subfamily B protein